MLNHANHANHIAMWYAMLNHAARDKLFWERHSQNLVTGLPARMDVGMVVTQEYLYCTYQKKMRLIHQYDLKNWCHEPWSKRRESRYWLSDICRQPNLTQCHYAMVDDRSPSIPVHS